MNDSVKSDQVAGGENDAAPVNESEITGQGPGNDAGTSSGAEPEDGGAPPEDLESALNEAQDEVNRLRDAALRAHAEMENVRRRAERDVQKAHKFSLERVMIDLLEVVDSMERGLLAADAEQVSVEQLKEGTELTHRLLDKVLAKHGLTEIAPHGETFNPEFHEALSMLPTNEAAPDTVVQVVQKGYLLNDRLIRPARVIVARQSD